MNYNKALEILQGETIVQTDSGYVVSEQYVEAAQVAAKAIVELLEYEDMSAEELGEMIGGM